MELEQLIREAKPNYIQNDIESVTMTIFNLLETQPKKSNHKVSWKRRAIFFIVPVALLGGIGFVTHIHHPYGYGVMPTPNETSAQEQAQALAYAESGTETVTQYGGFVHAKKTQSFPESEIVNDFGKVKSNTKEVLILGQVPYIRQDVIAPNNIKFPNAQGIKDPTGDFIQARHAIKLPSDEISHSFDHITAKTKEILAPNAPPFIRLDVITPDNRAAVDK